MQTVELKLKQASVVLGVAPKDLQNLVQFKVLRPLRRNSFYWFDNRLLLEAKVAFYLKESLGTSTEVLARFTHALSKSLKQENPSKSRYVWLQSRPATGGEPIEVRIPIRTLAKELDRQLPRAALHPDLPRGRKRAGWKRELTRSLDAAAGDLSGVTEAQIVEAIHRYKAGKKRTPEITLGGSKRPAQRCDRHLGSRGWNRGLQSAPGRAESERCAPSRLARECDFRLVGHRGDPYGIQGNSQKTRGPAQSYRPDHQPVKRGSRIP